MGRRVDLVAGPLHLEEVAAHADALEAVLAGQVGPRALGPIQDDLGARKSLPGATLDYPGQRPDPQHGDAFQRQCAVGDGKVASVGHPGGGGDGVTGAVDLFPGGRLQVGFQAVDGDDAAQADPLVGGVGGVVGPQGVEALFQIGGEGQQIGVRFPAAQCARSAAPGDQPPPPVAQEELAGVVGYAAADVGNHDRQAAAGLVRPRAQAQPQVGREHNVLEALRRRGAHAGGQGDGHRMHAAGDVRRQRYLVGQVDNLSYGGCGGLGLAEGGVGHLQVHVQRLAEVADVLQRDRDGHRLPAGVAGFVRLAGHCVSGGHFGGVTGDEAAAHQHVVAEGVDAQGGGEGDVVGEGDALPGVQGEGVTGAPESLTVRRFQAHIEGAVVNGSAALVFQRKGDGVVRAQAVDVRPLHGDDHVGAGQVEVGLAGAHDLALAHRFHLHGVQAEGGGDRHGQRVDQTGG